MFNWKTGFATLLAALAVIVGVNHLRLNKSATEAMAFRDVEVFAYYRYGVMPDSIVLDIRSVGLDNSAAGTIGGLIAFAEALKERQFREVVLSWRGQARFILKGDDFQTMGREAAYQNPIYTVRTLPEKLLRPDGTQAFSSWTGGLIGVLGQQMEDVNSFARQWYMADALTRL